MLRFGFLILLTLTLRGYCQQAATAFRIYNTSEGISNNTILALFKDQQGFIWIGTENGLNRFDGHSFKHFYHDQDNFNSLGDNYVTDLLEFQPGKLLIATNDGLSVLNTLTNNFENHLVKLPALKRGSGIPVSSLFMDESMQIWINHSGEIDVFDKNLDWKYRFTDLPWTKALKGINISLEAWFMDKQKRLWLPALKSLYIVDFKNQQVYNNASNLLQYPFVNKAAIRAFFFDEKNQVLWYAPWGDGLYKYNLLTKELTHQLFGLIHPNELRCINSIGMNEKGQLICGGGAGVYLVDTASLQFQILRNISDRSNATSNQVTVYTQMKSAGDEVWLGGAGLFRLLPANSTINQYIFKAYDISIDPDELNNLACYGIVKGNNGSYYLSYGYNGLVEFNPQTKKVLQFKPGKSVKHPIAVGRTTMDNTGKLWTSTSIGLEQFDVSDHSWHKLPNIAAEWKKKKLPPDIGVRFLHWDKNNNLWMALSPLGIARYNARTHQLDHFPNYLDYVEGFFKDQYAIHRITEDDKGNLWFYSFHKGGLLCYQSAQNKWTMYPGTKKNFQWLVSKGIHSIVPINEDELWLGSNYGLMRYNYQTDKLEFITRKDGLLSDKITRLNPDVMGNLLITNEKGINYFNNSTGEISSLSFEQTAVNWQQLYINYYDSVTDELIYGMNDRIVVIKNNFHQLDNSPIKTAIDKILVNNKPYGINSPGEEIRLTNRQNNISIDFTSISYAENNDLTYSYKLLGQDKEWKQTKQLATVEYTNLPAGNFTFLLRAKNQSGNWGPLNDTLKITIIPSIWQRSWFQIAGCLFFAALIYFLVKKRIQAIRKAAELKHKLSETEMMALRAQMNPHFIFNCLNAIDNLIQTNQKAKATTYLNRFARLIRSVLDSSKNNLVPFHKDFESLRLFLELEQFRCDHKFEYNLNVDPEILNSDMKVPPLIIQPFVENAIHHGLMNKPGNNRQLTVDIRYEKEYIRYVIEDNGIGRKKAAKLKAINRPEHIPYGIDISKRRVDLYNNNGKEHSISITDLEINNQPAGTRVELWLYAR